MPDRDPLGEIRQLVSELFGADRLDGLAVGPATLLVEDLGLSSLEVSSLLTALEARSGLRRPAGQLAVTELRTVADLVRQMPGTTAAGARTDPVAESMRRGARRRRRR